MKSTLNKFSMQIDPVHYRMKHPLTVAQFMDIEEDLPIYIMWIDFHTDKYTPELVGWHGYNNPENGLYMGGEDGRAGRPWLSHFKEFVKRCKVPRRAPVYDIAVQDMIHTIQDIIVTDQRIEVHVYDIDDRHYE